MKSNPVTIGGNFPLDWKSMPRIAAVDTETTGVKPWDRINEIAVSVWGPFNPEPTRFATFVDPTIHFPTNPISGISMDDVRGAPTFADIAGQVHDLLDGAIILGHNIPFDVRFIRAELGKAGITLVERPLTICTLVWSQHLGCRGGNKLGEVASHYGVDTSGLNAHRAQDDADLAFEVWRRMIRSPEARNDDGSKKPVGTATPIETPTLDLGLSPAAATV